jgi:serine/threonine-protein kinase
MTDQCSTTDLQLAIDGKLAPDREQLLFQHLEQCEACGAAIEELAGGAAWCAEAAALLAGDELDQAVPSREDWSDVDFTVEHLEASDEPNVLGRLGGYDVLEIIGRGGMSVVLRGLDHELNRYVAIKVLAPHLAQSSLAKKRFIREAQAAAAVVHPHVIAIHRVYAAGRLPFLVMPLVAGESLAQRLVAQGRLDLKETLRIGMQAAAGLAAAHEQGLVHRDVKPANILLEKGVERAVLTDFGLARAADDVAMTRWGVIAGTPQYMSPEQAKGEPLDGRSDLFSLGCVLYEMATGVSPFRADSTMATLRRLIDDPPRAMTSLNPELPPWFVAIVERLLEKDSAKRFYSAKEVSELLEQCLAHLQQPAGVPLPEVASSSLPPAARQEASTAARPPRRRKLFIVGSLVMFSLIGISLFAVGVVSTNPPEIAGQWSGDEWGQVELTPSAPGQYTGTYTDTVGKAPGKIELKWSRIERRFNGTWSEGDDRFGDLSVRFVDHQIRGALTTDPNSKINPATPRLADVLWTRADERTANVATKPAPGNAPPSGILPPPPKVQAEHILALQKAFDIADAQFQAGRATSEDRLTAYVALLRAQLETTESRADRIAILEKLVDSWKQIERHTEERVQAGRATEVELLRAKMDRAEAQGKLEYDIAAADWTERHNSSPFRPFDARLSNGVTVELIGVRENPSKDNVWWRPDGSRLAMHAFDSRSDSAKQNKGRIQRELAVWLGDLPSEPLDTRWQIDSPSSSSRWQIEAPRRGGITLKDIQSLGVEVPEAAKTMSLRFGVATGPWRTVIEFGPSAHFALPPILLPYVISDPIEKANGSVVVNVASNLKDDGVELRIIAEDKEGREHVATDTLLPAVADLAQLTATFHNLPLKQIKQFRLQARKWQWVEFRNVSLHAGLRTDVQVVAPSQQWSQSTYRPPPELQAKRILALKKAFDIADAQFQAGYVTGIDRSEALDALLQAQLEAATSRTDRIAILQKLLDNRRQVEQYTDQRVKLGAATDADLLFAKAKCAEAEIRLQEEKAGADYKRQ